MTSGFTTWKDVLDVVGVPVMLALLAIVWPVIQSLYRCRQFKRLAARELLEIGPFPQKTLDRKSWKDHLKKSFLHQKIIDQISDNRDFVLGLSPDFVYSLSQLWKAFDANDGGQWLHYLRELACHRYLCKQRKQILRIRVRWKKLIHGYRSDRQSASHPPGADPAEQVDD